MLSLQRLSNPKGKKFWVIIRFWETAHLPFPQANMTNKGKMLAKGRGQSLVPRNAGNIHWKDSREPKVPFFLSEVNLFFLLLMILLSLFLDLKSRFRRTSCSSWTKVLFVLSSFRFKANVSHYKKTYDIFIYGCTYQYFTCVFCLLSMVGAPVGNNELWRHTYNQDQCILGPGISASCVGN